jgi:hypothetical protein
MKISMNFSHAASTLSHPRQAVNNSIDNRQWMSYKELTQVHIL